MVAESPFSVCTASTHRALLVKRGSARHCHDLYGSQRKNKRGSHRKMDSTDAADLIAELHEERAESALDDRFRGRAALLIAALAAVLAIGGLGGGNATDDMVGNNIKASDSWAFYQAKNVRQTMYDGRGSARQIRSDGEALRQRARPQGPRRSAEGRGQEGAESARPVLRTGIRASL
ncbi:MAG: DUF4337 domain-containing protein [Alphaproteobacteria bacterium]|nr:MAG: DUF4337 domain-containing protein [Alphaproteobacteria bacterium]